MAQGRSNAYIYDPSQQIRKDLGNAAMSVEQGFQNVLDKKKQEYDFVQKLNQDAELLKKDLNFYNSELITKRSNDLVKETASAIKEKGKVDFVKLGELRRKVAGIADAKRNSELAVQAFGEVAKMAQANAANMRNPIETITGMMSKLKDEKYLFSPKNMYDVAMEDYKNGLDYTKIIGDKLQELVKKGTPVMGQFDAPDGSLIEYKGVVPFGYKLDEKTKRPVPNVTTDKDGNIIDPLDMIQNSISPELWEGYKKQVIGYGEMFNPNMSDHARDLINTTLSSTVSYSTKKDALTRQNEKLTVAVKSEDLEKKMRENSPEELAKKAEKELYDKQYKEKGLQLRQQSLGISQQRLGLAQEDSEFRRKDKGETSTGQGAPVLDTAGTYSAPMKNQKGNPIIRIGKKGNTYYSVDQNNKAKGISEFEANYIINSLPKEERGAAKQALGSKATSTTSPAPVSTKKPKPY